MSKNEPFRIALIFSPRRLVAVGVTAGDYEAGCRFIAQIRSLIDEFLVRAQAEFRGGGARPDKNVSPGGG